MYLLFIEPVLHCTPPLTFPFLAYPLDVGWGEGKSQWPWQYSSWQSIPTTWVESTKNPIFRTVSRVSGSWRKPVWFRCGTGRVVCIGTGPAGALGLEHTHLWVTDACSSLLMWPACETMAPQYYTEVHASDSLRNNSQLKKFFLWRAGIHSRTEGPLRNGRINHWLILV